MIIVIAKSIDRVRDAHGCGDDHEDVGHDRKGAAGLKTACHIVHRIVLS